MLWLRKYQVLSTGEIIVGVTLVWTLQFWSHPVTLASVIFIFHLKVNEVVNSCCCLVRILYFYSSYKIDFKFWKSLRTDGYVERVLVNDRRRWINSFTVFTIHRTTKDLNKSTRYSKRYLRPLLQVIGFVSILFSHKRSILWSNASYDPT